MARKLPKPANLKRRSEWRNPRLRIVIVCEGSATEPDYFRKFAAKRKNPLVQVELVEKGGPIRQLIGRVLEIQKRLTREARKSENGLDALFEVWGVPDVDEHPKLVEALNLAEQHRLNIALSNPCFELWGILHFRLQDAPIHRHAAQRLLSQLMPSYSHAGHPYFDMDLLDPLYDFAKKNAGLTIRRRLEEDQEQGNPSTNVDMLLDRIAGIDKQNNLEER